MIRNGGITSDFRFKLLFVLVVSVGFWFAWKYSVRLRGELVANGILVNAKIVDLGAVTKGTSISRFICEFDVDGTKIQASGSSYLSNLKDNSGYVGKVFPAKYSVKNEFLWLLICKEDYDFLKEKIPDNAAREILER